MLKKYAAGCFQHELCLKYGWKVVYFAMSCYAIISVFKMPYLRHVQDMLLISYDLCYIDDAEFAILYDLNKSKNSLT